MVFFIEFFLSVALLFGRKKNHLLISEGSHRIIRRNDKGIFSTAITIGIVVSTIWGDWHSGGPVSKHHFTH